MYNKCIPTVEHGPGFQKKKELAMIRDIQNRKSQQATQVGPSLFGAQNCEQGPIGKLFLGMPKKVRVECVEGIC